MTDMYLVTLHTEEKEFHFNRKGEGARQLIEAVSDELKDAEKVWIFSEEEGSAIWIDLFRNPVYAVTVSRPRLELDEGNPFLGLTGVIQEDDGPGPYKETLELSYLRNVIHVSGWTYRDDERGLTFHLPLEVNGRPVQHMIRFDSLETALLPVRLILPPPVKMEEDDLLIYMMEAIVERFPRKPDPVTKTGRALPKLFQPDED